MIEYKEDFYKLQESQQHAKAALAAIEVVKALEIERSAWLGKLHAAVIQADDKELTTRTTQILNEINIYPYKYEKLRAAVLETIVKNNT